MIHNVCHIFNMFVLYNTLTCEWIFEWKASMVVLIPSIPFWAFNLFFFQLSEWFVDELPLNSSVRYPHLQIKVQMITVSHWFLVRVCNLSWFCVPLVPCYSMAEWRGTYPRTGRAWHPQLVTSLSVTQSQFRYSDSPLLL